MIFKSPNTDGFYQDFLLYLEQVNRAQSTRDSYARDLRLFLKWCELNKLKRLSKISPQDISDYLEFLKFPTPLVKKKSLFSKKIEVKILEGPLAVNSRKRHLSTIKNFYAFLKDKYPQKHIFHWGFIKSPVLEKLHSIRLKDEDLLHTPLLREGHWNKVTEFPLKLEDRLLLYLMYWGGLRLSEVRTLKVNQLNVQTNVLNLYRKGGKRHELFLQDNGICSLTWEQLNPDWKTAEDLASYVFRGRFSNRPLTRRAAYKKVKKIFKKAGLPQNLSPHSLRKSCATRLYYQTKDLLFVRDYLGHSDAKVTQTYIETQGVSFEDKDKFGTSTSLSLNYGSQKYPAQESLYN